MNVSKTVRERYSEGAKEVQPALCCPVDYDAGLLAMLPKEIIEKDYGCGDPSRYVRDGDVVLDLGSGSGKICYMAGQLVGKSGRVIGVDMNDDMLELARKYLPEMSAKLGGPRVTFVKGHIQDLALDLAATEEYMTSHPVRGIAELEALHHWQEVQRRERPLIADNSVDLVISNCVLNLVAEGQKRHLVREIFRVVKPGGRVAISDIVSDEVVPDHLKRDTELWSGCISGAFQEQEFLRVFRDAGFVGVSYDKWDSAPWRVVDGIEFRSVTLTAWKSSAEARVDIGQAVIYRGPYATITDDEGNVYPRGERIAVCEPSYKLLTQGPWKNDFIGIEPATPRTPVPWCGPTGTPRPARETKGGAHKGTACGSSGCC
jgi:ubiquinone/menaquinone biosynthesis C-methylase UbiE